MDKSTWRILLVDDDEDDYALVRSMLSNVHKGKFLLKWASSYEAGGAALQADHYDAVLVDFRLGAQSGLALIQELVQAGYLAPMILLTGHGSYELDVQAMEAGAADYMDKNELSSGYLERSIRYAIDRKRAESERERLLEENRRQRDLLEQILKDSLSAIAVLQGPDHHYVLANPTYLDLVRKPNLIGRTAADAWAEVYDQIGPLLDRVYQTGEPYRAENMPFKIIRDGNLEAAWFNFVYAPFHDRDGNVEGIVVTAEETTRQVLARQAIEEREAALRMSEETLRSFFDSEAIFAGIIELTGDDATYIRVNQKLASLLNLTPEQVAGKRGRELGIDEEILRSWIEYYRRCQETGQPVSFELTFQYAGLDGIYSETIIPIASAQPGSSRFAMIAIDVTERKRMEQSLEDALAETVHEKNRLLAVMEAMPVGVAICNHQGGVIQANQGYEQVWGKHIPQTLRVDDYWVYKAWWVETDEPLLPDEWAAAQALQKGESVLGQFLRIQRFDGSQAYVINSAAPVFDAQGKLTGTCVAILDVTQRVQAENALRKSEQHARFLASLGDQLLSITGSDEVFRIVSRQTGQYLGALFCFLSEEDWQTDESVIQCGYRRGMDCFQGRRSMALFPSKLLQTMQAGQNVVVPDVATHHLTSSHADTLYLPNGIRALAFLPHLQEGKWLGSLAVAFDEPHEWQPDELELLESVANLAWLAIDNARTHQSWKIADERFRIALQNSPIVVFTQDKDLRYTWIHNSRPGFRRPEEVLGKRDEDLLDAETAAIFTELKRFVLETGEILHKEVTYHSGGQKVVYDFTLEPTRDEHGAITGLTAAAMDITELRKLEAEQLEQLAQVEVQRRLIEQREMERINIARDLHDGPLQELIAVSYGIAEAINIDEKLPRMQKLEWVRHNLHQQAHELRTFCHDLRPPTLAPFGLEKAIRSHIDSYQERYPDLRIHLDLAPDRQLIPEHTRMALYRLYQEAMNNVAKHSRADEVWINLEILDEKVILEIIDDGVGFDIPQDWVIQARTGHLGMIGMRERAASVDAQLEFYSEKGQGTQVRVAVPLGLKQPSPEPLQAGA